MNIRRSLLWRIVSGCAVLLNLYCSPIISPGLLSNKDFTSIILIKCITPATNFQWCSLHTHICTVLSYQHFNSYKRFSTSIINDPLNPLHPCLVNAQSTSNTRSPVNLLRCRIYIYIHFIMPNLACHLVKPKQEVSNLPSFPKEHSLSLICRKFMISLA